MQSYYIYKKDKVKIIYKVTSKENGYVLLEGINYRKQIKVLESEIEKAESTVVEQELKYNQSSLDLLVRNKITKKVLPGTVLHFDADQIYLNKCMELYRKIGVYCYPVLSSEEKLKDNIQKINIEFVPDVIVVTGHDFYNGLSLKEIKNYTNSNYFCEAVFVLRNKFPNSVIIAGACQSNFEALLASGATFASSPKRINVHVYDPAIIAIGICTTHFRKMVDFKKMAKYIKDLDSAFGGLETYGKMRMLY